MINIFIPIVEKVDEFCEFISKHKELDKHIYIGVKKSLKDKLFIQNDNVEIVVFDDSTNKEEILNGLQKCKRVKGKLLIMRRPLFDEEFDALTNSQCEIATLMAHHNKFVSWFKRLARTIVKKFFAFNFFEDISAICYGEFLHDLVASFSNLSIATRINKYVGVDIEEIVTSTPPVKKQYNKLKVAFKFLLGCLILGGSIAGAGCIFAFVNPLKAFYVVLTLGMLVISLIVFMLFVMSLVRSIAVGELEYGSGKELEVIQPNKSFFEEEKPKVISDKKGQQEKNTKTGKSAVTKKTSSAKKDKAEESVSKSKTTTTKNKTTSKASETKKSVVVEKKSAGVSKARTTGSVQKKTPASTQKTSTKKTTKVEK